MNIILIYIYKEIYITHITLINKANYFLKFPINTKTELPCPSYMQIPEKIFELIPSETKAKFLR